jgi:hypothetical protein
MNSRQGLPPDTLYKSSRQEPPAAASAQHGPPVSMIHKSLWQWPSVGIMRKSSGTRDPYAGTISRNQHKHHKNPLTVDSQIAINEFLSESHNAW